MRPKPKQWGSEYAEFFKDASIVDAYEYRPPYPQEVFTLLASLVADPPRAVLDAGCGPGDIARRLVMSVDRVDAVDFSAAMIEKGKRLPQGDHPNLTWIQSSVEEAPLSPPYTLITAGDSLHWFAWDAVFPRFAAGLTRNGVLALISRDWNGPPELRARLVPIFVEYGLNRDFRPCDLVQELELRGLFRKLGERRCIPTPWRPSEDAYIQSRFSHQSFSRDRMGSQAEPFAQALQETLRASCRDGILECRDGRFELQVETRVVWGKPLDPARGEP